MADKKVELNKEELKVLIDVLNIPRQQDLQTANFCIQLSNKMSKIIDELKR